MSIEFRRTLLSGSLVFAVLLLDACGTYLDPALEDGVATMEAASFYTAFERSASTAGGNVVIGSSRMEPGRRIAFSVRALAAGGAAPVLSGRTVSVIGSSTASINTESSSGVAVIADFAVQPFQGFRSDAGRILSVDFLISAALVPEGGGGDLDIESDGSMSLGFGARLGIIPETRRTPAVSTSLSWRSLPSFSIPARRFTTNDGGTMDVTVDNVEPELASLRITASKRFGRFGVTAGGGTDAFQSSHLTSAEYQPPSGSPVIGSRETFLDGDRTHLFVGASAGFGDIVVAAEVGRLSGSTTQFSTYRFDRSVERSRAYVSVGARMEFGGSADR